MGSGSEQQTQWFRDGTKNVGLVVLKPSRVGFTEEGVFLKATHYKGRNRDTAWFGITDDVWPEIEEGFGKWLDPSNFDENGEQKERRSFGQNQSTASSQKQVKTE